MSRPERGEALWVDHLLLLDGWRPWPYSWVWLMVSTIRTGLFGVTQHPGSGTHESSQITTSVTCLHSLQGYKGQRHADLILPVLL